MQGILSEGTSAAGIRMLAAGGAFTALLVGGGPLAAAQERQPDSQIEEVVVTAQHREERIQDIPISMSAFTGEELLGSRVKSPKDIARLVPGLFMNESALNQADPEFTLRGVGTNDRVSNQNAAISLYTGGIAVPYNAMVSHALFDMERVEVLKGPQGTLYGRNTTGGAVNFIPRRPKSEWGGYFFASYGDRNTTDIEAAANIPVSDSFALRISGVIAQEDGWQTIDTRRFFADPSNGTLRRNGDIDRNAVHLASRWEPTDDLEIVTSLHAGWDRSQVLAMDRMAPAYPMCSSLWTDSLCR